VVKWSSPEDNPFGEHDAVREIWLRPNRRAISLGTVPPVLLSGLGAWMAFGLGGWWRWLGGGVVLFAAALVVVLLVQLRRPRVAYDDGHVLFFLKSGSPLAVPVEVVEAFFVGQGPSLLPGHTRSGDAAINLIARLSQRETQWAQRDVKPALGLWCDSYVTIRGTWCEPLNDQVLRRLNRRLHEVTKERRNA
jgi:hypothetical protein